MWTCGVGAEAESGADGRSLPHRGDRGEQVPASPSEQGAGQVGAVPEVLAQGGDESVGLFDAVVEAAGGVRPDRCEGVAEQHRMSVAHRPCHAGGWGDVHHWRRHPGGGGVDQVGQVGRQVRGGVGVDLLSRGGADVLRQGEDPLPRWGTEPAGVLLVGGVEEEDPVAAGGYRGDVELHAGAGLQALEVVQVARRGGAVPRCATYPA